MGSLCRGSTQNIQAYSPRSIGNNRMGILDIYTDNIPLTQKARFWTDFVSSLKGEQDLKAHEYEMSRLGHLLDDFGAPLRTRPYRSCSLPPMSNPSLVDYQPIHMNIYGHG